MPEIFHLFNIKTEEPAKVFDALTTQKGLASWWTTATEATPKDGSIAKFRFSPDYHKEMKVVKLEKNKTVEWQCVKGDDEWQGTKLSFSIEPAEQGINVRFRHWNWKEQTDLFGICNYHWGLYMKGLKTYIETGKGNPHNPEL